MQNNYADIDAYLEEIFPEDYKYEYYKIYFTRGTQIDQDNFYIDPKNFSECYLNEKTVYATANQILDYENSCMDNFHNWHWAYEHESIKVDENVTIRLLPPNVNFINFNSIVIKKPHGNTKIMDILRGDKEINYIIDEKETVYSCMIDALISANYSIRKIEKVFPDYKNKELRISANDIKKFCEDNKGMVHFIDLFNNTIYKSNIIKKKNKHGIKVLTGILNHKHITIINDQQEKRKLAMLNKQKTNKRYFEHLKDENKFNSITKNIISTTRADIDKLFIDYIHNNHIKENATLQTLNMKFTNGNLSQFETMNDLYTLISKDEINIMKDIHNSYSVDTIAAFTNRIFFNRYSNEIRNQHTGLINDNIKDIINKMTIAAKTYGFNNNKTITAIDQNKSYSHIIRNIRNFKPTLLSKINKYNHSGTSALRTNNIIPGIYSIYTNDIYLFRGNGFYTDKVVKLAIDENINFTCDYYIDFHAEKTDIYRDFQEYLEETYGERISNKMIGQFVGCSYKRDTLITKATLSYDPYDVYYYHDKLNTDVNILCHDKINEEITYQRDLYIIKQKIECKKIESRIGIYIEVINNAHINNYMMMKKIGFSHITYIKTDCLGLSIIPTNINLSTKRGDYKTEKVTKVELYRNVNKENPKVVFPESKTWNETYIDLTDELDKILINDTLIGMSNLMILGASGTGKTSLMNNLFVTIKLAPTNVAARLINGHTFDSYFNSHWSSLSSKQISDLTNKTIFIDEISMLNQNHLMVLSLVKKYTNCRLIATGDFRQLPPVKDNADYENSDYLIDLFDQNKIILTHIYRYDFDYNNIKLVEPTLIQYISLNTPRAIVKTNEMRGYLTNEVLRNYDIHLGVTNLINCYKVNFPMICNKNIANMHYNSVPYTIEFIMNECEMIHMRNEITQKIEIYEVGYVNQFFEYNFAQTSYKAQGQTFNFPYAIFQVDKMDEKHLYVAVTRSSKKEYILNAI